MLPALPPPCEDYQGLPDDGMYAPCRSEVVVQSRMPDTTVLLVIDKSGSMGDEGAYGQSKWRAMIEALTLALSDPVLRGTSSVGLGLWLFPDGAASSECDAEACCSVPAQAAVDIEPPEDAVPDVLAALERTSPGGATPTAAVLSRAVEYFTSGGGSALEGNRYVLLVTDGDPDCGAGASCDADQCTLNPDGDCAVDEGKNCCAAGDTRVRCLDGQATLDQVEELQNAGVQTLVVGLPGSEGYADWFTDAGLNAETEPASSYHAVSADGGVDGLAATFRDVLRGLARPCTLPLHIHFGLDGALLNVAIDCKVVPEGGQLLGDGGAGGRQRTPKGWFIDDVHPGYAVQLEGPSCESLNTGTHRVDVLAGCPPVL